MSFACDKLSKLSMMSQQPLHLSKLPTLNISPGAEHEEGESGECLCSLGKIPAYTEDREGGCIVGRGLLFKRAPENILACKGHPFCSGVVRLP